MATKADGDQGSSNRGVRRREKTRQQLVRAAKILFGEQGIDGTRIQEITALADVGLGSFYNHFDDKSAIVDAVVMDVTERQAEAVDRLTLETDDPAEIVAVAHRHFLRLAENDPESAWVLIQLDITHRILAETLRPWALQDLLEGIDSGRFNVDDPALAIYTTGGALLGAMRGLLEGNIEPGREEAHAELVLRMLGLEAREAAEIAARPFPYER